MSRREEFYNSSYLRKHDFILKVVLILYEHTNFNKNCRYNTFLDTKINFYMCVLWVGFLEYFWQVHRNFPTTKEEQMIYRNEQQRGKEKLQLHSVKLRQSYQ